MSTLQFHKSFAGQLWRCVNRLSQDCEKQQVKMCGSDLSIATVIAITRRDITSKQTTLAANVEPLSIATQFLRLTMPPSNCFEQ